MLREDTEAKGLLKLSNHMLRRSKAFTLVELLVVVGIVGFISAILFPVFAAVREKGRRTTCLSNERQLAMAMTQYLGDNNETYPYGEFSIAPATGWGGACLPYYKDTHLLTCPDDSTTRFGGSTDGTISYAMNCNLGGVTYYPRGVASILISPAALQTLVAPVNTVLFFEASDCAGDIHNGIEPYSPSGNGVGVPGTAIRGTYLSGSGGQFQEGDSIVTRYATGNMGGRVLNGVAGSTARHKGGANYAACDGHVHWLRPEAVSTGMNALAPSCFQGTESLQPANCAGQLGEQAAGTGSGAFVLTFSIK